MNETAESDVLIVGGGPAGAVCAAVCARGGLRVTVLERATFPREKVCGDCLNPSAWAVFDRLGLSERVLGLPHAQINAVGFVDARGRELTVPLAPTARGEIAVKRSDLDALLLNFARQCGATVHENSPVLKVARREDGRWEVAVGGADPAFVARTLIAADGRNSTVARSLGLLPPTVKDRVGLQTHFPLPPGTHQKVVMRFLPAGYCGLADIGGGLANLCLVSAPVRMDEVKAWAITHFGLPEDQDWRSITPLERGPISPTHPGLLLIGDVARVVEPFTGEGIYYAMATGELAGRCLVQGRTQSFAEEHRALYRGRLWVNELSRAACKHPRFAAGILSLARLCPSILPLLTRKVIAS